MPEKTVLGKFDLDPNYNRVEDVRKSIEGYRAEVVRKLEFIDSINDVTLQLLGMFSMIYMPMWREVKATLNGQTLDYME